MGFFPGILLALISPGLAPQGVIQDRAYTQFYEALAAGVSDGLPALVRKLDGIAAANPTSYFAPYIQQTTHVIGIFHPGTVPDQAARLQAMKDQNTAPPGSATVVKRIEILAAYYKAAIRGRPESATASLADPVFDGSSLAQQAQADAALRAHNYGRAESLALQVIESDPASPLLANSYVVLGLSTAFRGDTKSAAHYFQRAVTISPLPTVYGSTQNYLFAAYRFARTVPAALGEFYEEVSAISLAGAAGIKDPQSLTLAGDRFMLADKEQTLTVAPEGKVADTQAGSKFVDFAAVGAGKIYSLTGDSIDLATGNLRALTGNVDGKPVALKNLRSLAVDPQGEVFLVDQEAGLFRGIPTEAGTLAPAIVAPMKGRLIRSDSRGYLYVLTANGKSVVVLTREGKEVATVAPAATAGRETVIEFFALDSLNHLFFLCSYGQASVQDANSIEIFAVNEGDSGLDARRISTIQLESRPQYKNLKVLAVAATGEIVAIGKNEGTWVCIR